MLVVTCESCKTKFRLDPTRFKGAQSKVRCSQCGHVFKVDRPDEKEQEEVFINLDEPRESEHEREAPGASTPTSTLGPAPIKQRKSGRASRLLIWSLAILLLLGGVAYGIFRSGVFSSSEQHAEDSHPEPAPASDHAQEPPAPKEEAAITISNATKAYFLENSHIGQIFVVEGEIVNEGRTAVSFILLEGKLYTTNNEVAQSQKAFCGNPMTHDELTSLPITDIQNKMMNREGQDMVDVHIAPKQKVRFTMVFHNLPELDLLSDYSVEVVSSQVD